MKKNILFIIAIFFIIMCVLFITLRNVQANERMLKKENKEYEIYLNKEIYGTDLASIINKIIDHNEKNNVPKNQYGYYIENNQNSITLEVKMKTIPKAYKMEQFYNNDITKFVENFNEINFKCIEIKYNEVGKVSKLIFEEIEEIAEEKNNT